MRYEYPELHNGIVGEEGQVLFPEGSPEPLGEHDRAKVGYSVFGFEVGTPVAVTIIRSEEVPRDE